MGRDAPTLDSLERRIRKILLAPTTKVVRFVHPNFAGQAEWENGSPNLLISIDSFWNGEISVLVHELAHYALKLMGTWGELEEPMILGLEKAMVDRIMKSPSRGRWWRKALARKLRA